MNNFQISIIAVGLAMNLMTSSVAGGVILKGSAMSRQAIYILVMAAFQALATGAGLILGNRIGMLSESHNAIIALFILLIMGIKVTLDTLRTKPEAKSFEVNDNRIMLMVSLAEAFTPLAVSIAVGLVVNEIMVPFLIIWIIQLLAIMAGIAAGSVMGGQAYKLRLGPVGGLILLAAAMKLIINVIGY